MECNFENCGYYIDDECTICGMGTDGEDTFCKYCKDNPNCYYKQLAELKAENERLKEEIKQLEDFIKSDSEIDHINHKYTYKLKQTLQEIKKIAKDNIIGCFSNKCDLADEILQKITKAEEE